MRVKLTKVVPVEFMEDSPIGTQFEVLTDESGLLYASGRNGFCWIEVQGQRVKLWTHEFEVIHASSVEPVAKEAGGPPRPTGLANQEVEHADTS